MNKEYVKWITERNFRPLKYQNDAIVKVQESMKKRDVTVLAACPSAGKTLMSIFLIEAYLKENPTHNVLVLTHGQTVLRSQYFEMIKSINPNFTYEAIVHGKEYQKSNKQVIVTLPQSLGKCQLKKTHLVVVDEAHHFYFAEARDKSKEGMVKRILQKIKPDKQLLLTGTPSKFVLHNFHIVPVTVNTVFDEDMVSDMYVEIASSTYNFKLTDYNTDDELKLTARFKYNQTKTTLDDLIHSIVNRLKSIKGNDYTNLIPEWAPTLIKLKKTMFACKRQSQAQQVMKYFENIGIDVALSISDTDDESTEIERFKNDNECLVLIVVDRGVLGFNYPELVNIVDMTNSKNIDRVYQLVCRGIRKHPNGDKKFFIKVVPHILSDYFRYFMTGVLCLNNEYYFTHFNGKNFNDMKLPVRRRIPTEDPSPDPTIQRARSGKFQPVDFDGLPMIELFKDILHKKDSKFNVYAYTTFRNIHSQFLKNNSWVDKNDCIEDARKYNTISEWKLNSPCAYSSARKNGWLKECTEHMTKLIINWTTEKCIEDARKYDAISEWYENSPSAYNAAKRLGCFELCISHMNKRNHITKDIVLMSSKECATIKEWYKKYPGHPAYSRKFGCYNECTKHMIRHYKSKNYWTVETCIEDARKYNTISEWQKNSASAYMAARRLGCIDKCVAHMKQTIKPDGYWTKERCYQEALKYKTRMEFCKNSGGAYVAATRNGWLDEICSHMNHPKKGGWSTRKKNRNETV